jgi:hypothetical protein
MPPLPTRVNRDITSKWNEWLSQIISTLREGTDINKY